MVGVFGGREVGGEEGWEGGRGDPGGEVGEMGVEGGSEAEDGGLWWLEEWRERVRTCTSCIDVWAGVYLRIRHA